MNITLISANSYRIINKEIKKIVNDREYIIFNMNKSNLTDVLEEASYVGFVDENKILVVSNADFFGSGKISEDDTKKLQAYLDNPIKGTTIIFTTLNGIDLRKKIVKTIKDKYNLINVVPWDKKRIREEVTNYLKEFNYSIDYNAVSYIMDNTYNNIDVLFNELDKITLYYNKPCSIKLNDVENIVGREVDSNNFHFVAAVIDKDLENSIRIMQNLKVYKVETIALINLLAREYRLMYYTKKMMNDHCSISEICKNLSIQEWQVNKLYSNSLKYSEKEILKNISLLGELDLKIKKGIYDKDAALYTFLMDACI